MYVQAPAVLADTAVNAPWPSGCEQADLVRYIYIHVDMRTARCLVSVTYARAGFTDGTERAHRWQPCTHAEHVLSANAVILHAIALAWQGCSSFYPTTVASLGAAAACQTHCILR